MASFSNDLDEIDLFVRLFQALIQIKPGDRRGVFARFLPRSPKEFNSSLVIAGSAYFLGDPPPFEDLTLVLGQPLPMQMTDGPAVLVSIFGIHRARTQLDRVAHLTAISFFVNDPEKLGTWWEPGAADFPKQLATL